MIVMLQIRPVPELYPDTERKPMNPAYSYPTTPPARLYPPPAQQHTAPPPYTARPDAVAYDTRVQIEEVPPPVSPQTGQPPASRGKWYASRLAGLTMMAGGGGLIYAGVKRMGSDAAAADAKRISDQCRYSLSASCSAASTSPAGLAMVVTGGLTMLGGLALAVPQSRRLVGSCLEMCCHNGC